jgi:hypothetical protein
VKRSGTPGKRFDKAVSPRSGRQTLNHRVVASFSDLNLAFRCASLSRKRLEHGAYEFEAAEASFELLVSNLRGAHRPGSIRLNTN